MNHFSTGAVLGFAVGAIFATAVVVVFFPSRPPATGAVSGLVDVPTPAEADAAFKRAKSDQWSLSLGQCSANTSGPGVTCAVDFKQRPDAPTRQGVVAFSRAPSGWMAVHLY